MPCLYCNAQFTITKWKTKCNLCHQNHCSQCMVERKCRPCHSVVHTNYKRSQLMKLKVKELRMYLKNRSFPVESIKEKHELVKKIQSLEGVHEPESETYTQSYSNTRHTWPGQEDVADETSITDQDFETIDVDSEVDVNNLYTTGPGYASPPTYTQTQESFPTASEFQAPDASSATTSNSHPTGTTGTNLGKSSGPECSTSTPHKGELLKLCEISSVNEIHEFSVRQLKYLLKDSLVDYRGILEKGELLKRALNLYEDHQKNQESIGEAESSNIASSSNNTSKEENFCKICWDNPVDCVFLECAHMVTCIVCSKAIRECPICREHIVRAVRVFKS